MCPASIEYGNPIIGGTSIDNIGYMMIFTQYFLKHLLASGFSNNYERFIIVGHKCPEPPFYTVYFDASFINISEDSTEMEF
jgi:hypothetical protein